MNDIKKILTKSKALKKRVNNIESKANAGALTAQEFMSFLKEVKSASNDMIKKIDCILEKNHK